MSAASHMSEAMLSRRAAAMVCTDVVADSRLRRQLLGDDRGHRRRPVRQSDRRRGVAASARADGRREGAAEGSPCGVAESAHAARRAAIASARRLQQRAPAPPPSRERRRRRGAAPAVASPPPPPWEERRALPAPPRRRAACAADRSDPRRRRRPLAEEQPTARPGAAADDVDFAHARDAHEEAAERGARHQSFRTAGAERWSPSSPSPLR